MATTRPDEETPSREAASGEGAIGWLPRGLRYMAAAAFFFSVMSLLVKLVGRGLSTREIVFLRGLFTVLFSWTLVRRAGLRPWGRRRGLLLVRGLLGFSALLCFFYALVHLPLADATVIQYTNPVFTALLAAPLLDERLRRAEVLAALVSLGGVVLVARPHFLFGVLAQGLDPIAVGIGLTGALCSAGAYVTVRRLSETEDPLVIVFYFALVTAVASAPLALPDATWPSAGQWAALAGIGLTAQVAQVFMTRGLQMERAGRATSVGYLQIVFAAAWGLLLLHEVPHLLGIVGALLVCGGTALTARAARRRPA